MPTQDQVKNGVFMVVGFMIVTYLGAYMLPNAFDAWFSTNTSDWSGGAGELWTIVPLLVLVGVILYFVGAAFDLI